MFFQFSRSHSSSKRTQIASVLLVTALALVLHAPILSNVNAEDHGAPQDAPICDAPAMSSDEYARAVSNRPDDGQRSYEPAETAPTSDANAAVETMNRYAACRESGEYQEARSLYTPYGLYWSQTNMHNIEEWNDHQQTSIDAGSALSPAFDPEAAVVVQDNDGATPEVGNGELSYATQFSAENLVMLEDGRVAVLYTVVLPAGSQLANEPLFAEMGSVTILMNVDGNWLIDETLPLCFSNCGVNRAMLESVLLIIPAATPAATPTND